LFVGGIASTIVDIRLIFSIALKSASTSIVISHNHPSGTLKPSQQDLALTKRLREGCQIFEIKLVDHLILSPYGNFYSMADEGDLYSMAGPNN
jgi:DNA repair protein RadC